MIAVLDTSPISTAVVIGIDDVLPHLYEDLRIPAAVAEELAHPRAPRDVRRWIAAPPPELTIEAVDEIPDTIRKRNLQDGESAALALALRVSPHVVILDDYAARRAAEELDLRSKRYWRPNGAVRIEAAM